MCVVYHHGNHIMFVCPLYKGKGDLSEMGNYRPISVIPHLSKILEKSVKYQLMAYLTEHKLITDYQMAYMKGHSTQMAMNYNKFLSKINNGLYTCACLIDLSKCFDCVHNELLLQQLTHYDICNIEQLV